MSILDRIIEYSNISKPSERVPKEDGGMLVQPSDDGSRLGYKKDNPGSISFDGYGYNVKVGGSNNPNSVSQYFSKKNYGSLEKAKKAAEQFRKETVANFEFQPQGPQTGKQAAAEKAIQGLLDEGKEVTTAAVKERLPKNLQKDFSGGKSYFDKAKKSFPNLDFKKSPNKFLKAPKDIAEVKKLIEDGLPLKEIQAKGYDVGFIKRVANNSNLEIAETSLDYFKNVQKITKDLTKIGKNKKIIEAFENGTMSKDLINQVGKVTKSNDPFYDSRLLFKLAEYYDGSLEEWYKPKLSKPSSNQIANSDKVIKSSATFLGGKRNGYAYQNFLYEWGAKKIDKVLDLPLGTFKAIQRDIAKTLPTGISLDEVFGVKSSGRYSPIEGILTNPLETKVNRGKGSFVDNLKSFYQKKLIDASEDPKKQKEILKEYNDSVKKAKVRDPSLKNVELPNYKVGEPPNKTIKGFDKLPLSIQNKLLENYEKTNISPVTKKATSIFDVAKAIKSKTFGKLDEGVQAGLSNISSNQEKKILGDLLKLAGQIDPDCAQAVANGGRIGLKSIGSTNVCLTKAKNYMSEELTKGIGTQQNAKTSLIKRILAGSANFLKQSLSPKELLKMENLIGKPALYGAVAFDIAMVADDVLRKGLPLNVAAAKTLTGSLLNLDENAARAKNLLESNVPLSPAAKEYAQSFLDYDQYQKLNLSFPSSLIASKMPGSEKYFKMQEDLKNKINTTPETGAMDYQTALDEFEGGFKAKPKMFDAPDAPEATPLTNKFALPASAGLGRSGPMTAKQNLQIDLSLPTYDRSFTASDELLNSYLKSIGEETLQPGEGTLFRMREPDQRGLFGTQEKFAGGGIAKLAGVSKGPPPESGPNPQGLNYLIKRVTNS
jgi:hypothetical protein